MSKVTVALLTYNRPKYLKKAIDAILAQSYRDFEFLICDNGSSEETQCIIKSYTDNRIVYIRKEVNDIEFYNTPFYVSKGEYLIITHDDDVLNYKFLEKEVEVLDKNDIIVAVGCNVSNIDENDVVLKEKTFDINEDLVYSKNMYLKYYLDSFHLPCPTVLMRKSFFLKNNLKFDFSAGPGADTFLWYKVSEFPVKMCLLKEVLYNYRVHPQQDSSLNRFSFHDKLYKTLLEDMKSKTIYAQESEKIIMRFVYDNFSLLDDKLIDYHTYVARLEKISLENSLKLKTLLKIKIYQKVPLLVKKILILKIFFLRRKPAYKLS